MHGAIVKCRQTDFLHSCTTTTGLFIYMWLMGGVPRVGLPCWWYESRNGLGCRVSKCMQKIRCWAHSLQSRFCTCSPTAHVLMDVMILLKSIFTLSPLHPSTSPPCMCEWSVRPPSGHWGGGPFDGVLTGVKWSTPGGKFLVDQMIFEIVKISDPPS